jgi:hypothetical protein
MIIIMVSLAQIVAHVTTRRVGVMQPLTIPILRSHWLVNTWGWIVQPVILEGNIRAPQPIVMPAMQIMMLTAGSMARTAELATIPVVGRQHILTIQVSHSLALIKGFPAQTATREGISRAHRRLAPDAMMSLPTMPASLEIPAVNAIIPRPGGLQNLTGRTHSRLTTVGIIPAIPAIPMCFRDIRAILATIKTKYGISILSKAYQISQIVYIAIQLVKIRVVRFCWKTNTRYYSIGW